MSLTLSSKLAEFLLHYVDEDEPNVVYKYLYPKYLCVLEKTINTCTNEGRLGIVSSEHASYRANELKVIVIVNLETFEPIKQITSHYYGLTTIYKTYEIVKSDSFDEVLENISSNGIHYFKTPKMVLYYSLPISESICTETIEYKEYDENGKIIATGFYKESQRVGKWIY
jgi:hypothetical protein